MSADDSARRGTGPGDDSPARAPLRAPHQLALSYRRSLGRAERTFLSGLARRQIWGSRDVDGRVSVPPVDWDPEAGAPSAGFVPVDERGRVDTWTWVPDPAPASPLGRPHAVALIRLNGANTSLLHLVDVDHPELMSRGMAVKADWADPSVGGIRDIRAFVPDYSGSSGDPGEATSRSAAGPGPVPADGHTGDVDHVISEVGIGYAFEPGWTLSAFLHSLAARRIVGGCCPGCAGVYVPPRPRCPACGGEPMQPRDLPGTGTVTAYTVVHIPFPGLTIDLPFTWAWIRLDGASVPFAHLLGGSGADPGLGDGAGQQVRVGLRVEPVWVDDADLAPTWESIRYFRPIGPPGAEPGDDGSGSQ